MNEGQRKTVSSCSQVRYSSLMRLTVASLKCLELAGNNPLQFLEFIFSSFRSLLSTPVIVLAILLRPTRALSLFTALSIHTSASSLSPSLPQRCNLHSMSTITLSQCITPSRSSIISNPFGATTKKGKSKIVDQARGEDGEIVLPDYVSPPAKDSREKREWDRMSTRMEGFHSYCKLSSFCATRFFSVFSSQLPQLRSFASCIT